MLLTRLLATAAATLVIAGCSADDDTAAMPSYRASVSNAGAAAAVGPTEAAIGTAPQATAAPAVAAADVDFIYHAAAGGLAEVQSGQLALQRSASPAVIDLANMMIRDHSLADASLDSMARARGIPTPIPLDAGRQAVFAELASLSGPDFDAQYLASEIAEHQVAIALFRGESELSPDPELRGFAAQTLPVLESHLDRLRALSAQPPVAALP